MTMPQKSNKTNVVSNPTTPQKSQPTAAEMRQFYNDNKDRLMNYASAETALTQLTGDVNKTVIKNLTAFDKETLRGYYRNITGNSKNLRNLSRYLYYRCHPYFRLIQYNANMFMLQARSVIPNYDLVKSNNKKKLLKSYNATLDMLEVMNLQLEFYKVFVTVFREDVFYGISYLDKTGFFILPWNPDYAKIVGIYQDGSLAWAMDMTFFKGTTNLVLLEKLGEPFTSLYAAYDGKSEYRWQIVPEEYSVCEKYRIDDWENCIPPFSGIFNGIINTLQAEDVQAITDLQAIYKLVWLEMETRANAKNPNEWQVDPKLMIDYFNRMCEEALPDYTSAAIVPGKLNAISFDHDYTTDVNKTSNAVKALFNSSGGAQILNSESISGTTAFTAAMIADTEFAISPLLPQTQAIVNRLIKWKVPNPCKIMFFPVSVYTAKAYKDNLVKDGTYGLPLRLAMNTFNNFTEKDTLALNYLEVDCLGLNETFIPLQSSHTSSNTSGDTDSVTGGRPPEDVKTDDGEASEDKSDRSGG